MTADIYFRDVNDVRWRLDTTFLYIGKQLWRVESTAGMSTLPASHAVLCLRELRTGESREVPLSKLPVSALFSAPRGYIRYSGQTYWCARGPVRDRHQGLKSYSMWYAPIARPEILQGMLDINGDLMMSLAGQGHRLCRKNWGYVSKDVLLQNGECFYRNNLVGEFSHEDLPRVRLNNLPRIAGQIVKNAIEKAGCHVE